MGTPEQSIDGILGNDYGTTFNTDSTARPDPDEDRILALGVVHQLDHLVQQDAERRHSHSVADRQHWSDLVRWQKRRSYWWL